MHSVAPLNPHSINFKIIKCSLCYKIDTVISFLTFPFFNLFNLLIYLSFNKER